MSAFFDVTLLISEKCPQPNEDNRLLIEALNKEGLRSCLTDWQQPLSFLSSTSSVLFRSTRSAEDQTSSFRKLLKHLNMPSFMVWNSIDLIRWNMNHRYLADLRKKSVPVLPSKLFEVTADLSLEQVCESFEAQNLLVKAGRGSSRSHSFCVTLGDRFSEWDIEWQKLRGQSVLIQPLVETLISEGTYSLIFIEGRLSHTILTLSTFSHEGPEEELYVKKVPTPPQALQTALFILDQLPEEPLYAKVDLVRSSRNRFLLTELDLIEPELFLTHEPKSARQLASAISKQL